MHCCTIALEMRRNFSFRFYFKFGKDSPGRTHVMLKSCKGIEKSKP